MVREVKAEDVQAWVRLRAKRWPDADFAELASEARDFLAGRRDSTVTAVFVDAAAAEPFGFLELGVRAFVDGCDSRPVPHVGRALMGSDTRIDNEAALRAHVRCGFAETERLIKLRKLLA